MDEFIPNARSLDPGSFGQDQFGSQMFQPGGMNITMAFITRGRSKNLTLLKFNSSPLKSDHALAGKLPSITFEGRFWYHFGVVPAANSRISLTSWAQISTSYKWSSYFNFFTPISRLQISPHLQPHLFSVIYTGTISTYLYRPCKDFSTKSTVSKSSPNPQSCRWGFESQGGKRVKGQKGTVDGS